MNSSHWGTRFALALAAAAFMLGFDRSRALAQSATPVVSVSASPVATAAAGGEDAPAKPAAPSGPSPSPGAGEKATANDPCGGPGRLLATLNRPTVGFSACAVPPGSIVLENGYQNQSQSGSSPNISTSIGQGFQRIGVAERVELDIIAPNYNRSRTSTALATGYSDLGLGFKYELPQSARFTYAVDGLFTAATGTGGFSAGGPTQTVNLDIAYSASPAIGFATTLGGVSSAAPTPGGGERFGYFFPSVVVTAQIPNYYQFYAELVGQTKLGPDQGGRIFTDFGLQKLLGPSLELDLEYGISFTPIGGSRFNYIGAGAGVRVK